MFRIVIYNLEKEIDGIIINAAAAEVGRGSTCLR